MRPSIDWEWLILTELRLGWNEAAKAHYNYCIANGIEIDREEIRRKNNERKANT